MVPKALTLDQRPNSQFAASRRPTPRRSSYVAPLVTTFLPRARSGYRASLSRVESVAPSVLRIMTDSSLSIRDREAFLAQPHVAALSVSAGSGRGPLTVPIWFQYTPGGHAWVLTEAASRKARLIAEAGRFKLMVDRVLPTVRYVSVGGPVIRTVPEIPELVREIAERYLPQDKVQEYVDLATAEFGEQVAIFLRPERWLAADLGPGATPPRSHEAQVLRAGLRIEMRSPSR